MKPAESTLNPNAQSYIPLSKREGHVGGGEYLYAQPPPHSSQNQTIHDSETEAWGVKNHPGCEVSMPKKSSDMANKQMMNEDMDMDMDMEFLLMTFPGLSQDSLADVYSAYNGDLESTIDMLTQLEMEGSELDNLPDSLDIYDDSESKLSKQRNAAKEITASSSGIQDTPDSY